jgi:hypothetical protein
MATRKEAIVERGNPEGAKGKGRAGFLGAAAQRPLNARPA